MLGKHYFAKGKNMKVQFYAEIDPNDLHAISTVNLQERDYACFELDELWKDWILNYIVGGGWEILED